MPAYKRLHNKIMQKLYPMANICWETTKDRGDFSLAQYINFGCRRATENEVSRSCITGLAMEIVLCDKRVDQVRITR